MADLTITAANVAAGSGATIERAYNAGATITAGQAVYFDTVTNTWKLCDADSSATVGALGGVALHAAASGQPLAVLTAGNITIGATVAVGRVYVASATPGGIAPHSDLTTGWYTAILGIGISTTVIAVGIQRGGVAYA